MEYLPLSKFRSVVEGKEIVIVIARYWSNNSFVIAGEAIL
jgi:hypothetical protein